MGPQLRAAQASDLPAIRAVDEFAFGTEIPDSVWAAWTKAFPTDRTWVAEVGGAVVGQTTSHRFEVSVPGGWLPAAGVTFVAVHPAHTRRGVLRGLMTRQLVAAQVAGEPLAVLWASEPAIYGRYGYGPAAEHLDLRVPADPQALPVLPGEEALRVWTPEPAEVGAAAAAVLARVGAVRPGVLSTDPQSWPLRVLDAPERRGNSGRLRAAVVTDEAGEPNAYALFAPTQNWANGQADGSVAIREFAAVDAVSSGRLWRFLMSLDLMARLHWEYAPSDEPLPLMTHQSRQMVVGRRDSLWCRLLDLPRALESRSYAGRLDLVLDVRDELLTSCAGRWRLRVDEGGARCTRTDAAPDLSMDVSALSAAYLGGQGFTRLAGAGLVTELSANALEQATTAFRSAREPWCPFVF